MNVADALKKATSRLCRIPDIEHPRMEAEALLASILQKDRLWLYLNHLKELPLDLVERYEEVTMRRLNGEPLAYITGRKEFWSLYFEVTRDTLIPRPETELIIETALSILTSDSNRPMRILDLGSGSGVLAISLLYELPCITAIATDISYGALLVARRNAERNGVASRISFIQADWLSAFKENSPYFDMIVSNPPYVALNVKDALPRDITAYEPHTALFSGMDGLKDISRLITGCPNVLKPGGWLLCEIGWNQEEAVIRMVEESNRYMNIKMLRDYSGNARVLAAMKS
ncbi:MAG: peptide chain release factor N(5)-glutamine methyltransferase [Dissulfurimicrobium sp.]|uniref:peptide chain release factor N(5)-glutamine methyltransferase n=1 Tax=Dissulfurimicrobium TaxID=1769732 RepID=UPI003C770BE5